MTSMPQPIATPKTWIGWRGTRRRTVNAARPRAIAPALLVKTSDEISRCSLCGAPAGPHGIHLCPRLYGR